MTWIIIGAALLLAVLLPLAKAHRGYWYQRGMEDGAEIEKAVREGRPPRWEHQ